MPYCGQPSLLPGQLLAGYNVLCGTKHQHPPAALTDASATAKQRATMQHLADAAAMLQHLASKS